MVRRAKQKHYETAIKSAKGNTVKLWKHINSFKQSKPVTLPKILSINNEIITEQDRILEELNKVFVTLPRETLQCTDNHHDSSAISDFVNNRVPSSVEFNIPWIFPWILSLGNDRT